MEEYKQEFIEFMVESNVLKFGEFTPVRSLRDWVSIMQRRSMILMVMILMCCSDQHIRESHLV